ncbi:Uncharacterised protein [Vibrio cholerae]|nr:Uncharacterised protein [Vibrio cholerae]CSC80982.1 Uncharacterised protein [Vibrio cholerae]
MLAFVFKALYLRNLNHVLAHKVFEHFKRIAHVRLDISIERQQFIMKWRFNWLHADTG